MEMSIPALYEVNQWYTEIIAQYTTPCPLISGHAPIEGLVAIRQVQVVKAIGQIKPAILDHYVYGGNVINVTSGCPHPCFAAFMAARVTRDGKVMHW
uniref:Uncharacterized protein n=1 Tax=Amphimedon queenslandica TaxID=400682 RepID=A0A1X7T2H8_AMPQE